MSWNLEKSFYFASKYKDQCLFSKFLDLRWKKHILISESSMQQYFNTILVVGIFFHVLPHCAFADDVKTGHFFLPRTQTIHGMPRNSQWVVEFSHVSKTNYSFNYPCAYALYLKSTGSSITYIYIVWRGKICLF